MSEGNGRGRAYEGIGCLELQRGQAILWKNRYNKSNNKKSRGFASKTANKENGGNNRNLQDYGDIVDSRKQMENIRNFKINWVMEKLELYIDRNIISRGGWQKRVNNTP